MTNMSDVVNNTPEGKKAVEKAVKQSIADQEAMSDTTKSVDDELRSAIESVWGGGVDYALSPDFEGLTDDEKDALYIRYRDRLIDKAMQLIATHDQQLLEAILKGAEPNPTTPAGENEFVPVEHIKSVFKKEGE